MKVYTSYHQLPELQGLSRKDRCYVFRHHSLKPFRHWQAWLSIVLYGLLFQSGNALAIHLVQTKEQPVEWLLKASIALPFIVAAQFLLQIVLTHYSRPHIRQEIEFLRSKGLLRENRSGLAFVQETHLY